MSVLGFFFLLYGTCVSAFCSRKARHAPHDLSEVESTPLNGLVALASIPAAIWTLVYVIGHIGFVKGSLVWLVVGIATTFFIQVMGFSSVSGLHLILAAPAIILGTVLTIKTHPF